MVLSDISMILAGRRPIGKATSAYSAVLNVKYPIRCAEIVMAEVDRRIVARG